MCECVTEWDTHTQSCPTLPRILTCHKRIRGMWQRDGDKNRDRERDRDRDRKRTRREGHREKDRDRDRSREGQRERERERGGERESGGYRGASGHHHHHGTRHYHYYMPHSRHHHHHYQQEHHSQHQHHHHHYHQQHRSRHQHHHPSRRVTDERRNGGKELSGEYATSYADTPEEVPPAPEDAAVAADHRPTSKHSEWGCILGAGFVPPVLMKAVSKQFHPLLTQLENATTTRVLFTEKFKKLKMRFQSVQAWMDKMKRESRRLGVEWNPNEHADKRIFAHGLHWPDTSLPFPQSVDYQHCEMCDKLTHTDNARRGHVCGREHQKMVLYLANYPGDSRLCGGTCCEGGIRTIDSPWESEF